MTSLAELSTVAFRSSICQSCPIAILRDLVIGAFALVFENAMMPADFDETQTRSNGGRNPR